MSDAWNDQDTEKIMLDPDPVTSYVPIIPRRDPVTHPEHYTGGEVEPIDYIEDRLSRAEFVGHCKACALKYISRAPHKGKHDEDLRKATWYLLRITGEEWRLD